MLQGKILQNLPNITQAIAKMIEAFDDCLIVMVHFFSLFNPYLSRYKGRVFGPSDCAKRPLSRCDASTRPAPERPAAY
jgi:hypothetical protein